MFYNFRTCYITVSNMRRYGHKCHFRIIIFYSTFSLSSQYLIQRFLSLLIVFSLSNPCSLSCFFRSPFLTLKSTVQWPHRSSCCHRFSFEDSIAVDLKMPSFYVSVAFSLPSLHADLGFVSMVDMDVGLCRWWVWDVGLFGLVDVGLC